MGLDPSTKNPPLGIQGFQWLDLYDSTRLAELAVEFDAFVNSKDTYLFSRFEIYRIAMRGGIKHGGLTAPEESNLLIELGRDLSQFLAQLFEVGPEMDSLRQRASRDGIVAKFRKEFVTKRAVKVRGTIQIETEELDRLDRSVEILIAAVTGSEPESDREYALASTALRLIEIEREYPSASEPSPSPETRAELLQILGRLRTHPEAESQFDTSLFQKQRVPDEVVSPEGIQREAAAVNTLLDLMVRWCAGRWNHPRTPWSFSGWMSFRLPETLHFDSLVEFRPDPTGPGVVGPDEKLRRRDGFVLTDPRFTSREAAGEAQYCIYCHERKKDSCSRGFVEKDSSYRLNPLAVPLTGCPLDERIGEANLLRSHGDSIGALSMVTLDNPMCPGTGHRICNDCMKACIFQKQSPVDIPQIETGILTDVLDLPYGFEIYSLLTRWNPLNVLCPVMKPYNGHNVLVVGLGPAGYTLAHYLANEGFGVVGIDGLKIEPMPQNWVGDAPEPIADVGELWESLDHRVLGGFGGVSEYGITVRWDKNFLACIRLTLERRRNIRFYGGIRFGGTITIEDAFDRLGFDHIAIAAGAGTPTMVRMKNNLIRGIRKASDFLMALQLTGAFKTTALASLQVRLPAVVIGGGLTAIDTATELFAYYPRQAEKTLERYERLCEEIGEEIVRSGFDPEEATILDELLGHGRQIRAERGRAEAAGEAPDFVPLVRAWGGVTIAYRKNLADSPAYRLNHEEVVKSLEEGISYAERLSPVEAVPDERGHIRSLLFEKQTVEDGRWHDTGEIVELPARSVMVAAGTSPNIIYEKEHPGTFKLDKYNQFFQAYRLTRNGSIGLAEADGPNDPSAFFTSYTHPGDPRKRISFYGDNHPRYAGNVVKAMASARDGFAHVTGLFDDREAASNTAQKRWQDLLETLDDGLLATVHEVNRLTPTIIEVVVRAPFAAERFLPGQFYRLQNYETLATRIDGTPLLMEGIALTGAWTKPEEGLLSLIILEMGTSSRLCAALKPGEPIVVMGPTGAPTEIPKDETVLLAGGGLGNAVLFSIARALKDNGCRVVYFAGYKRGLDVFKQDEIEASTHQVVWAVDRGDAIPARRAHDLSFVGNIVEAMLAYATGDIISRPENLQHVGKHGTPALVPLGEVRRIIAIGSDGMMRAVGQARHTVLEPHLSADHVGIGSINSPMQCMMKQVCAQCLQRHVDPVTGKESFVFSCFNQDQYLDVVDFDNLRARLRQNSVSEKLANLWLTRLLTIEPVAMV